MQKEHFKSDSAMERQEIIKRKDCNIKTVNGIKVEKFKSKGDQGNKRKKLKRSDGELKQRCGKQI